MILEYCYDLYHTLEELENLLNGSEKLQKDYENRIKTQIDRQSVLAAFLLAGSLIIWFLPGDRHFLDWFVPDSDQPEIIFLRMFAITFIALFVGYGVRFGSSWLWSRDYLPAGRRQLGQLFKKKYHENQEILLQEIRKKLENPIIRTSDIPSELMNPRSLKYIIDCLEAGEVRNLTEAIQLLELDSRDTQVQFLVKTEESTLARAQRLAQKCEKEIEQVNERK